MGVHIGGPQSFHRCSFFSIQQTQKSVTYAEENYDFNEKLVSFQFAPRSHTPPAIFFSRFLMATGFPNEVFHIVHDFQSSLQYTINDRYTRDITKLLFN
jgi:hypothetical protein